MDKETKRLADTMLDYMSDNHSFEETMQEYERPVLSNKAKDCVDILNTMLTADLNK